MPCYHSSLRTVAVWSHASGQTFSGLVTRLIAATNDSQMPRCAGERLLAVFRQFVKTSPPLPGFLHPTAFDPAALFQPVKQEIKRGGVELQHAVRARLDQLADFVTMTRAGLQQR